MCLISCHRAHALRVLLCRGCLLSLAGGLLCCFQGAPLMPPLPPVLVHGTMLCTHMRFRAPWVVVYVIDVPTAGALEKTQPLELERPAFEAWFCPYPVLMPGSLVPCFWAGAAPTPVWGHGEDADSSWGEPGPSGAQWPPLQLQGLGMTPAFPGAPGCPHHQGARDVVRAVLTWPWACAAAPFRYLLW